MELTENKATNIGLKVVVMPVSSVRVDSGSIVPERFTSISSPVGFSLIAPDLGSTSSPRLPIQGQADFDN